MQVFRHAEDRLPVTLFTTFFALDVLVYTFVDNISLLVLWFTLSIIPKGMICAWNHHHQHLTVFRPAILNRLLEIMYGLQTGILSHAWALHHSLGHHVNYLDQKKDESRWRRADGKLMGELEYSLVVGGSAYARLWRVGKRVRKYLPIFVTMAVLTLGIAVGLFIYRPLPALLVFIIPMGTMVFYTAWATYTHHAGKQVSSHFVASNNILHRGYNIVTGNLGYHTAHHLKPMLHWSGLPALHAEIAEKIPADCYLSPGLPWNFGQQVIGPPPGMAFAAGSSLADDCEPTVRPAKTFAEATPARTAEA